MRFMPFPGGGDDALQLGIAGFPAELLPGARGVGDELRRIAGAARADGFWNRMAGNLAAGVDDLPHAVAAAGAQVEVNPLSGSQCFERHEVGLGQIVNVDIVADATAVRGWIVVAENRDPLALAESDLEQVWNQMRFRNMIFS